MLKELLQEMKQNAAKAEQMNAEMKKTTAELTAKIDAKFEQSAANAEINIAEITDKIDAQETSLTEVLEQSNADINA